MNPEKKGKVPFQGSGIEVRKTICSICNPVSHCGIDAYIQNETIIKVEGTKENPHSAGTLCIRCRCCLLACPFGAPRFPDDGKMAKCDFCVSGVEDGLEPACVRVCPTRALGFGPLEDLAREKSERASRSILDAYLES
jgi:Fe-S-cluster-containing dehydrogenase component